ncbi:MAG: DUF3737 family protein [Lachnospiraceae bacterium]|nr:DUF3737 family protein [Lachnospiraceae bacterium]
MKQYIDKTYDEERALYGSDGVQVINCKFDGPADGESALKESKNIEVDGCYCNLRYPFWHDTNLKITNTVMTDKCRAALWYSKNIYISDTKLHGIKALRECKDIEIVNSDIISPEFGWSVSNFRMSDSMAESEYFMMRSDHLNFDNVKLKGKYSFQYISDCIFTNCNFDTKDAFWHGKNILIKGSIVKGEYLAWYSENLTFENCTIIGTQPLCYCKNLKMINCQMIDADLSFEKSEVDATILSEVISIKNPKSGKIYVPGVKEIIMDDENAKGEIIIKK